MHPTHSVSPSRAGRPQLCIAYLTPDEPDGKSQGEARPISTIRHRANMSNPEVFAKEAIPILFLFLITLLLILL